MVSPHRSNRRAMATIWYEEYEECVHVGAFELFLCLECFIKSLLGHGQAFRFSSVIAFFPIMQQKKIGVGFANYINHIFI